jgi:deazaflavin-dependent oxidoreductase (nitroreductase family)
MGRRAFVLVNRCVNAVVRTLGLRRFRGADLLVLTTTGRKSGKPRPTPLIYLRQDERWIVVASNGGANWEPAWWLNLQAGGAASVQVGKVTTAVRGEEVDGPEREQLWKELNESVFDYASYQAKVDRRLAVVALVPTGG